MSHMSTDAVENYTQYSASLHRDVLFMDNLQKLGLLHRKGPFIVDFSEPTVCIFCREIFKGTAKVCSACKGAVYCSLQCQQLHWKKPRNGHESTHKKICPMYQDWMKHAPYFREQLLQFPWSRLEKDNSFNWNVVKTRLGLLGEGPRFGYWSHPHGHRTHDESPTEIEETTGLPAEPTGPRGSPDYIHGQVMLNAAWPLSTIDRQWKLSDRTQIPTLFFADERDAPSRPAPGEVKDWETWYKWRGLPLSSPVALLMDRVLSVHHILANVLRVADVKQVGGSSHTALTVHYLGAEVELNFIPLFSEIALLLPDTHIDLTIFCKAGYDLVHKAREKLASSPSSQVIAAQDIVWSYTAPLKTGGGSIAIRLHSEDGLWTTQSQLSPGSKYPDAMVALNAGLASYSTWSNPVLGATIHNIPFAVTDYDEQGLWTTKKLLPKNLLQELSKRGHHYHMTQGQIEDLVFSTLDSMAMKEQNHQFASNPFHRPGQRSMSYCRLPFVYNGFVMPVVMKGDSDHERDE